MRWTRARRSNSATLVAEKFPDWLLTPLNANDYKMTMKPTALLDLKRSTVQQSLETIERRVNALGLTEPTVQAHGDEATESEILVELPGVDDPAYVKQLIGTTAQLKISEVKERRPMAHQRSGDVRQGRYSPDQHRVA